MGWTIKDCDGHLIHQFDITTCRKTARTACHVAGFLKEQAIPIPSPPIFTLLPSAHFTMFIMPRCQRRVHGGPILSQRRSHSENSQFQILTLVLSPHRGTSWTACRSEGAEVVFGRRVQWRHCRYLPVSATQRGSPLATSCCCCRVRLCPDLTSGALSAAATEEDLDEASIWNEFVVRIPNITINLSNDLFSTNHYNILGFWMISAHLNMGSLIELLFNSSFEDAL